MNTSTPSSILVFFHCGTNNGYSIAMWERAFWRMAMNIVGDVRRVHFAYATLEDGPPRNLPEGTNVLQFDSRDGDAASLERITSYVREHDIRLAFGFDQPVWRPAFGPLRRAGVRTLLSYWGAPISGLNSGVKLALKRLEVQLSRHQPDFYIFQNEGMARTATHGRGIPRRRTIICPSGVDTARFAPDPSDEFYAHDQLGIPRNRRIVHYSGHMERRKGIHVIMDAAVELVEKRRRDDVHFVLVGNRDGVEQPFLDMIAGSPARGHVTFGGYRPDVDRLLHSAYLGVLATTGWDSFPVSGMEMCASGLPMIVSDLLGVNEMVDPGVTGVRFPPGDASALATLIERYVDDPALRAQHATAARSRMTATYTHDQLVSRLTHICTSAWQGRLDGRRPLQLAMPCNA